MKFTPFEKQLKCKWWNWIVLQYTIVYWYGVDSNLFKVNKRWFLHMIFLQWGTVYFSKKCITQSSSKFYNKLKYNPTTYTRISRLGDFPFKRTTPLCLYEFDYLLFDYYYLKLEIRAICISTAGQTGIILLQND